MEAKEEFYIVCFYDMGEIAQYDMKCCSRSEIKKISEEPREKYQFVFVVILVQSL